MPRDGLILDWLGGDSGCDVRCMLRRRRAAKRSRGREGAGGMHSQASGASEDVGLPLSSLFHLTYIILGI